MKCDRCEPEPGWNPRLALSTARQASKRMSSDLKAETVAVVVARRHVVEHKAMAILDEDGAGVVAVDFFVGGAVAVEDEVCDGYRAANDDQDAEVAGFDEADDAGEPGEEDIDAVVELSGKKLNARSLEIRRALEERRERKKLQDDLDYLDFDCDDD